MKKYLAGMLFLLCTTPAFAQVYISTNADITLFSEAPIENIKGETSTAVSALNINNGELYFKVAIRSFNFHKRLMQEHFNEDYLQSDKFPYAQFKGKILDSVDLTKPGTYSVKVKGYLTLHNVTKECTTNGNITVKPGEVITHAVFSVKPQNYDVKIPTLLTENIAQNVQVTVNADYRPKLASR
ncbi:MAG: YceI family protein [Chitinophagaceae bacterium]